MCDQREGGKVYVATPPRSLATPRELAVMPFTNTSPSFVLACLALCLWAVCLMAQLNLSPDGLGSHFLRRVIYPLHFSLIARAA